MLGVLLATLYASASRVGATPIAYAIADSRRNPVTRESVMPTDIVAVFRRNREEVCAAGPASTSGSAPVPGSVVTGRSAPSRAAWSRGGRLLLWLDARRGPLLAPGGQATSH